MDAKTYALEKHGDQRYGNEPYGIHLQEVVDIVEAHIVNTGVGFSEATLLRQLAWLHDVREDTAAVLSEIEFLFGRKVAQNVELLTDPDFPTRTERKLGSNAKFAFAKAIRSHENMFAAGLTVKAADRLANVRRGGGKLSMYAREYPAFRSACYVRGTCDGIWLELDMRLNFMNPSLAD